MKAIFNFKRLIKLAMLPLMAFLFLNNQTVKADNHDVLDQANVINAKTEAEIKTINQEKLGKVKGKPQIAVVTRDSLKGTS